MPKIIIHNESHLSDEDAVARVWKVMKKGRYDHGKKGFQCETKFPDFVVVTAQRRRDTDTFNLLPCYSYP